MTTAPEPFQVDLEFGFPLMCLTVVPGDPAHARLLARRNGRPDHPFTWSEIEATLAERRPDLSGAAVVAVRFDDGAGNVQLLCCHPSFPRDRSSPVPQTWLGGQTPGYRRNKPWSTDDPTHMGAAVPSTGRIPQEVIERAVMWRGHPVKESERTDDMTPYPQTEQPA